MEVIRQDNLTVHQLTNSFKNSNTFVIAPDATDKVWLVDIGDISKILSAINNRFIVGVFLTHAHLDHIYGISEICKAFPDCMVYGSEKCIEYLFDDKKNLSFYYERPLSLNIKNCHKLSDRSKTQLSNGLWAECFYTPGHSPDSACYQVANLIFTGDAFIPGIPTVTKLRGGNKLLAAESIKLIQSRTNSSTIILPGHRL